MTTVYLMRHGNVENPDNVFAGPEFPLSERGRQQIKDLAAEMRGQGIQIDVAIASPFVRAQETAELVLGVLRGPDLMTEERLKEWQVGPWFGQPIAKFFAETGYGQDPPNLKLAAEIESLEAMGARVAEVVNEAVVAYYGKTILIVAHREPLVAGLLTLQGQPFNEIRSVSLPMASLWKLDFNERRILVDAKKVLDHSQEGMDLKSLE